MLLLVLQYTVAVDELIFTTIWGVVAVCVVGFLMIPHWTAVLFVGPLIIMLYFYLLGFMQVCGIHINAVTYVTVVISIGLLVDFLMHILLRYYETTGSTREAKVRETLETMGASMMLGGFTTWLGVIPLALSTTKIFMVSPKVLSLFTLESREADSNSRENYIATSDDLHCLPRNGIMGSSCGIGILAGITLYLWAYCLYCQLQRRTQCCQLETSYSQRSQVSAI
jgi:hypothetical protein